MLSAFEGHKFKPEMIHFKDNLGTQTQASKSRDQQGIDQRNQM